MLLSIPEIPFPKPLKHFISRFLSSQISAARRFLVLNVKYTECENLAF